VLPHCVDPQLYLDDRRRRGRWADAAIGSPEINSREFAHELSKQFGQQVIVENRPGASGIRGYELTGWSGIAVPAAVPREIVMRLHGEINKAIQSPVVQKGVAARGGTTVGGTPEQFGEHVRKETERIGKLIKSLGIKPQ
jgi:tripartite-type tricarboxylate transporter receptor subunit TctC